MGAFPVCSAAGFILAVYLKALKPQAYPSTQLNHSKRLQFSIYPPFPCFSNQMQAIFSPLENVTLQLLKWGKKKIKKIMRGALSMFHRWFPFSDMAVKKK